MNSSEKIENENVVDELEQSANAGTEAEKVKQTPANADAFDLVIDDSANSSENLEANNDVNADTVELEHADNKESNSKVYAAMLTTVDNPFDPFDQFDDWFRYDEEKGYHTCSYLGRIIVDSDQLSDEELRKATEEAIDQILQYDFMNIYKKVRKPVDELETSEK